MPFQLIFPDSYLKRAKKFIRKHPELIKQYEKTLLLLELNPYHPSLRLHQLQGRLSGLSSISINMSYRLVVEFKITETEIILLNVGSHEQVY
ncbi:type II toxin-antitoxin system YafQ family toxin [Psychromonas antarctica]|uniref:type II toxin-antitoxin system RelE/ParE family toxin n=1 Tax=Psychromonas antarctica TaxID=67573 RepID=UPI001EE86BD4|nr:type II toxin-antitoxin system mRNA interferase toxin, RelE/StbE family [Psychromonas antarctica]MCG6201841.1 type II toxin-antitoxin system mRNA interferase toxin, RelE/StbE family [Psychromonas antarctica]